MRAWKMSAKAAGLGLFLAVAVLNGLMAISLGQAHPLMALWALAPAPLVLLLLLRGPKRKAVVGLGVSYLALSLVLTVALWGVGWMVSVQLRDGALLPDPAPPKYDLEVMAVEDNRVTLRATPLAKEDGPWGINGRWGLEANSGSYHQVGAILERGDRQVVRELLPVKGNLHGGEMARLDSWALPGDPRDAYGLSFKTVSYSSPLGEFPSWLVEGPNTTWAIFVHGKGAEPRQGLRILPVLRDLGMPVLLITYRNDGGVPSSEGGFYRYGQTEYQDLEGAVKYALEQGAQRVVLVGYSMGGGIVASFLYHSPLARHVVGVVLDAPMIDFNAVVDFGARQKGHPKIVILAGKAVSRYRYGVDWSSLDYLKDAKKLAVPILLFHSDADETVPIESSEALARKRPDIVTYMRFPGAPHVASWNVDSEGYTKALRDFLADRLK